MQKLELIPLREGWYTLYINDIYNSWIYLPRLGYDSNSKSAEEDTSSAILV